MRNDMGIRPHDEEPPQKGWEAAAVMAIAIAVIWFVMVPLMDFRPAETRIGAQDEEPKRPGLFDLETWMLPGGGD